MPFDMGMVETTRVEHGPLIGEDVKEAVQNRSFGCEIMSAPFVIAHRQVGGLLTGLKAPLDSARHRPRGGEWAGRTL